MRRRVLAPLTAACAALLAVAAPAGATGPGAATEGGESGTGWEPAPSPSWSYPAGARCDFAVQGAPVVDEVVRRTVRAYPDGTKLVEYKGALMVRVVNTATGASYDADASGHALVEVRPDHSQRWYVLGPVLAGFGADGGNVPRGLYTVDGAYTLDVSPTGYKTLTMLNGTTDPLCDRVS
ncbi:hypothetical protein ACFY8W_09095 [Streptomyces sp. NPDC012637]|uniref:hypothetical protein n=1 Tax=Streptomyces sp. NPDC012637 TaxID=3364842 RepID=UPI0036E42F57